MPVVAEKILENHGSISVYQNGYVIYRAHKRVTVFSLRNCVHYKYDALEGAGHHIEEEELMNTSGTSVWFWKERIVFS